MRLFLPILIWIFFVGGLWGYIHLRETNKSITAYTIETTQAEEKVFTLILTPTFSAEKDPFALTVDTETSEDIQVQINGNKITLPPALELQRGQQVVLPDIKHILVGKNELFVQVSPPLKEAHLQQGLRIQLVGDQIAIVDTTAWSQGGAILSQSLLFDISQEEHDHDH